MAITANVISSGPKRIRPVSGLGNKSGPEG